MAAASANIFDLLNDDAPDQEIHIPAVKKETKPAKPAVKQAPSKPTASTTDSRAPRTSNTNRPRDNEAPRGERYDRNPRDGDSIPRQSHGSRGARGGRGGRGGRHGGFDRHSGTGINESENKENNRLGDPTSASLDAEKDAAREGAADSTAFPEPAEPEEVIKTLDDYLQEQASRSLNIHLPETRIANAGTDESKWKDAQVLEARETGDFIKMGKESVAKSRKGKKESKITFTELNIRFTETSHESAPRSAFRGGRGGDRGGRGGDRGGRGDREAPRGIRGGNSGSHPRGGASVNVDDQDLFPTLGSH